jgi:hypothetical protein
MESTKDKAHPLRHPPRQGRTEAALVVAEAAVVTVATAPVVGAVPVVAAGARESQTPFSFPLKPQLFLVTFSHLYL